MYKACWRNKGRLASVIALSGMLISASPVTADEVRGPEVFVPQEEPAVAERKCPGCAECQECAVPNTGRISFNLGMDFATQYIFRGIVQENAGFIGQPYAGVDIDVYQGDGPLNNVTLTGGIWNSIHSRENSFYANRNVVRGGGGESGPDSWYEADVYGGVKVGLLDTLELSTTYTAYTSPNDEFETFQEVAFGLGIDDSDLLGDLALSPSVLFAIETENSAFGPNRGTYVEIRGGPEFSPGGDVPVTLALPMRAGFSLDDYYSSTDGNPPNFTQTDPGFGFFDIGLEAGVPLEVIPSEFGAWKATAGVHFTTLGRTLRQWNNGDDTEVYGLFGIGMSY